MKRIAIVAASAFLAACASVPKPATYAGDVPAEISAMPGDEFSWRGRNYTPDRMGDAIRAAKASEGVTSVVLLYGDDATVQDIVDVAIIARAAGLPAFYKQGDKLNPITVSR
ncbi:hypothetical protein [Lysobacter soli]|nr:hypothetical protein [Lysobacter soli]